MSKKFKTEGISWKTKKSKQYTSQCESWSEEDDSYVRLHTKKTTYDAKNTDIFESWSDIKSISKTSLNPILINECADV